MDLKKIKKNSLVLMWFIIAYSISQLLVYLLSKPNFMKTPMYILLPVFGFFALYYTKDYFIEKLKINNLTLIISFIILSLIAEYLALFIFHWNTYGILNDMKIQFDFFKMLLESAFLPFIVSGIFGIIAKKK